MKTINYAIIAMLLCATFAHAEIAVYQVLYDPVGTESGGEAIEIKNNGDESVDLSGWLIATDASDHDAKLPDNTVLLPGKTFLVADELWDQNKDNASWKKADHMETLTLGNINGFVALVANNHTIDAVSWGNMSVGTNAPRVSAGNALRRSGTSFEEAPSDFFEGIPVALSADVTLRVPLLEITPSVNLAPEGVLAVRNSGDTPVTITLRVSGLSYKNNTLPASAVEIEGAQTFTVAPQEEYRATMKLHAPQGAIPGKYRSTLRVVVSE